MQTAKRAERQHAGVQVYVTVFADGPTRVLQFSDEPNVANADADLSIIDLAARLKQASRLPTAEQVADGSCYKRAGSAAQSSCHSSLLSLRWYHFQHICIWRRVPASEQCTVNSEWLQCDLHPQPLAFQCGTCDRAGGGRAARRQHELCQAAWPRRAHARPVRARTGAGGRAY